MARFTEVIKDVTCIVNIPNRTPEEKKIRNREIKDDLLGIYRQLEIDGKAKEFFKCL